MTQRCSNAEERYTQSQADLNQVSAFLDSAWTLNSSLNAQLDSEKMAHVAEPPELFQLKCLSPTLEARPHLNRNKTSVPQI
jgi:hypothetical protein